MGAGVGIGAGAGVGTLGATTGAGAGLGTVHPPQLEFVLITVELQSEAVPTSTISQHLVWLNDGHGPPPPPSRINATPIALDKYVPFTVT